MKYLPKIVIFFSLFFLLASSAFAISEGDLVINEIMQNPQMVADTNGEWFELYNSTSQAIDLREINIDDNGTNHFIITGTDPILIPAYAYFVLGRNANPSENGGVNVDYQYPGFQLTNDRDEIVLTKDGVEIDRVEYDDGATFPDPTGASMALLDPALDNSLGENWTTATTPYGNDNLGTPGQANFPAPTNTPTPTSTPTPTPTSTPTSTPSPIPTPTSTVTPTATPSLIPTTSPSPTFPRFPYEKLFQKKLRSFFSHFFSIFRP